MDYRIYLIRKILKKKKMNQKNPKLFNNLLIYFNLFICIKWLCDLSLISECVCVCVEFDRLMKIRCIQIEIIYNHTYCNSPIEFVNIWKVRRRYIAVQ
jgi:hypothetical protein